MRGESASRNPDILPVPRSKVEAKRLYDRLSRFYDCLTSTFERKHTETGLVCLSVGEGEIVLEIGFGTGHCLQKMAISVGKTGKAYGVDISSGMLKVTRKKLARANLINRVGLCLADAGNLPYVDNAFDAVFMSYTLELFDTPEIPIVLQEVKRVLKPGGRLGVVSMSKENGESRMVRLYQWAHGKWPKYLDCRPIYVEQFVREGGYKIVCKDRTRLFGLPGEIVVGVRTS